MRNFLDKTQNKIHPYGKLIYFSFALYLSFFANIVFPQNTSETMSDDAKAGQKMQNPLYPQIQLPFTYNYNQKLGANNQITQGEFGFSPIIPVDINSDMQLIVSTMLTFNRNSANQQVTNQYQPVQLALTFTPKFAKEWYAGIGPYFQAPASNANNGTRQMGVGVAGGAFFMPENWVLGALVYNSWGVGSDLSGGTANVLNVQPVISYTTDDAWTFNLAGQYNYNYTANGTTNQLTLSGGRTIKLFGVQTKYQIGPTYMVTTSSTSAKGFGGFFGLTFLLPK